jgi:L-threonylcarbamoyladenylate synthase
MAGHTNVCGSSMSIVDASGAEIGRAGDALRAGRLVAFPTETVYGLGADATNGRAVAQIFASKGRPRFNPLIVHVTDLASAEKFVVFNDTARRLAAAFWPGPMTLVLPKLHPSAISELVTAGLDTVGVRIPSHGVARALLAAAGVPVAAPSANRSGRISPTAARHVADDFPGDPALAVILDGGSCDHGIESSVLAIRPDRFGADVVYVLRPGSVTAEMIAALGIAVGQAGVADPSRPQSPGQLDSHYAPAARVRLNAVAAGPDEALLAFGPVAAPAVGPTFNLSPGGDPIEAAANLFAGLRALDLPGISCIAVMPIPDRGIGAAINDRLSRAAAAR